MTLRAALVFILVGFIGLLLAMGLRSFVEWLKRTYPRRFRMILAALAVVGTAAVVWTVLELMERPAFQPHDLITLHEPVVAKTIPTDRGSGVTACIVDNSEHLAVVAAEGGTLTARVESNNRSGAAYCVIGLEVHIELAWLHRYSLTRRSSS
jgi:Na+/melibiose symporter-like transporter